MTVLLMNIPLVVLFVALWAGIPAWLVLRHPDQRPEPAAAAPAVAVPAVAVLPASRHDDAGYRRAA